MKTIVLSGPGKNALSTAMMERVLADVRAAGSEPVFLTGEGDAFSAGLDLKEVAELDAARMARFLGTLEELVRALYEHPAPLVAWINGHAIAGGCVLALTADLRIATSRDGVRIGLNETALGVQFPPVTFAMVRARVPAASLERVVLEAALHDANAARELGLVDLVGEEAEARAALERLAAYPRAIYAATKRAVRGSLSVSAEAMRLFREETIPHWASPDRRAALRAALDKKR